MTLGTTDRAGASVSVSIRELARDLGLPNLWRKWTLDGMVAELARLAGEPLARPCGYNDLEVVRHMGLHADTATEAQDRVGRLRSEWVTGLARGRREKRAVYVADRTPLVPYVTVGMYQLPAVIALFHYLLEARGVECLPIAALSTRLLAEGKVRVIALP